MGKGDKRVKWMYMVYTAGDNNLDPVAPKDIEEVAKVGFQQDLQIVVQFGQVMDRKTG